MRKVIKLTVLIALMVMIGTTLQAQQLQMGIEYTIVPGKCGCGFVLQSDYVVKAWLITPYGKILIYEVITSKLTGIFGFPHDLANVLNAHSVEIEITQRPSNITVSHILPVNNFKFPNFYFPFWDYPPPARHNCY